MTEITIHVGQVSWKDSENCHRKATCIRTIPCFTGAEIFKKFAAGMRRMLRLTADIVAVS